MPEPVGFAASVQYGDTFAVVGGANQEDGTFSNAIYVYDADGDGWNLGMMDTAPFYNV